MDFDNKIEKILVEVENFFKTENDPEQAPASVEGFRKLKRLHPSAVKCFIDEDKIVSVAFSLPTSKTLALKFINGDINERQLLELTEPMKKYGAIYFHLAFTLPEYQKKGLTVKMFNESVTEIPHDDDALFLLWPVSDAGTCLMKKIEKKIGITIINCKSYKNNNDSNFLK